MSTTMHVDASPRDEQGRPLCTERAEPIMWVRTSQVAKLANPFEGCWNLSKPVTLAEVKRCLADGNPQLHESFAHDTVSATEVVEESVRRRMHIEKIAWFVLNGFHQPLNLDVGVPFLGYHVDYPVLDGNHRLASAIYRFVCSGEDLEIPLLIDGSIDYAQELGLWRDNAFTLEQQRQAAA